MKHLDSEYRRRWEEYHLSDGTIKDSREINWRDVDWTKVVKLVASVEGKRYEIERKGKKTFKFFMRLRWGGKEAQYNERKEYIGHKNINIWTIGWTDGKTCHLQDIDFYTGDLIKKYRTPLKEFKAHIHPKYGNPI